MTTEQKRLTGTQAIREILERVKENPNGVGDAALDLHGIAVAEVDAIEADNAALLRVGKQVEALLADVASSKTAGQADYPLCEPVHARELLAIVRADHPGAALLAEVERLRAQAVPVTEDDLTALEMLLASAKQGDVWAWLERARVDMPKLLAEVRRFRAAKTATPAEVEEAARVVEGAVAELAEKWGASPVMTASFNLLRDLATDAAELRSLFEKQHERTRNADALWRVAHGKPDVTPDLGDLIDWLVSCAGTAFTISSEQRTKFENTLTRLEDEYTPMGPREGIAVQALRMVLAMPTSAAPPPTPEQDALTCPFCVGLSRKPDTAPRAQWKPHPDGLACPFAGHVCTPGLHLPEVPAQPVDVGALLKQVQSLPPEVAERLWAALGVVPK